MSLSIGCPAKWITWRSSVAAIDALPPMTDEQIEAIAEVIIAARERRRHIRQISRGPRNLRSDVHSMVRGPETGR